jgi:AcrR family transcriptional regulator
MAEPDPFLEHAPQRLLEGMAHAVADKGYADTTIADIVREAGVSRRTFYEHFAGKAECLVALYEAASHNALKVLRDAIDPATTGRAGGAGAVGVPGKHGGQPGAAAHAVRRDPGLGRRGWPRAAA